jgi:tetratricopeptide (TPR) repeat protein
MKLADRAMQQGAYYEAASYYQQAMVRYDSSAELLMKYADALRGYNDYATAQAIYHRVATSSEAAAYPLALFWESSMLHSTGDYLAAANSYTAFLSKYRKEDYYSRKAKHEIESCAWAMAHKDSLPIVINHLPEGINTPYTESNPYQNINGQFSFSSLRNIGTTRKEKYLSRIYTYDSTMHVSSIDSSVSYDPTMHIANGALCPDRSYYYFTQCDPQPLPTPHCELYVCERKGTKWDKPMKVGGGVNRD